MRVLMLGWEFPPFISGGLGTACYGLTRALNRQGVNVLFVLPKSVAAGEAGHVRMVSTDRGAGGEAAGKGETYQLAEMDHVIFRAMPASLPGPYPDAGPMDPRVAKLIRRHRRLLARQSEPIPPAPVMENTTPEPPSDEVEPAPPTAGSAAEEPADAAAGEGMMQAVEHYAQTCLPLAEQETFDIIHAHDWMTYPAGVALAQRTGKPLVVHVHSTEYDRAGERADPRICAIERQGMHAAGAVVCVSYVTAQMVTHRYEVPADRVEVIHNGIDSEAESSLEPTTRIERGDRIVLFLGRITYQKGPEYFLAAAKKVLEKYSRVKFIMAGSGDMVRSVIQLAKRMGIERHVLFTGFLKGEDVARVFQMADVYVMPSVSEPFGIAPLEAIRHDVPVIISRRSGVAEVLKHALKVDFWDVDDIADKVLAVLRHPVLSQTLREQAELEVRGLSWEGAAGECVRTYQRLLGAGGSAMPGQSA